MSFRYFFRYRGANVLRCVVVWDICWRALTHFEFRSARQEGKNRQKRGRNEMGKKKGIGRKQGRKRKRKKRKQEKEKRNSYQNSSRDNLISVSDFCIPESHYPSPNNSIQTSSYKIVENELYELKHSNVLLSPYDSRSYYFLGF